MWYSRLWRFIIKFHCADPVVQNIRVRLQRKRPLSTTRPVLWWHRSLRRFQRWTQILHRYVIVKKNFMRLSSQSDRETQSTFQTFSVCNRTYYGDVGRTYSIQVPTPQWNRIPFLCHLTFTASGHEQGDIVQVRAKKMKHKAIEANNFWYKLSKRDFFQIKCNFLRRLWFNFLWDVITKRKKHKSHHLISLWTIFSLQRKINHQYSSINRLSSPHALDDIHGDKNHLSVNNLNHLQSTCCIVTWT